MNENKPTRLGNIIEWALIVLVGLIAISAFVQWWTG